MSGDARRVLVAGVGNTFLGDDGFGPALCARLRRVSLPQNVRVVDFGIRALALAEALSACDVAILLDATLRGGPAGTLYVLEPRNVSGEQAILEAHTLTPEQVLSTLPATARPRVIRIVGCEPQTLEPDEEEMGLSAVVRAAVEAAVPLVERLLAELQEASGDAHA